MILLLLISFSLSQTITKAGDAKWNKDFYSNYDSYLVQAHPGDGVYKGDQELYERAKCKSCCRVIFASEFNYQKNVAFNESDPTHRNDYRLVMDNEFDDKRSVRTHAGSYEQNIYLRVLDGGELQFWEFAPYMMYTSFTIPKRVHDIRGGADVGSTLIIWNKKPPLDPGTENQRFIYVHPYPDSYYPELGTPKTCNSKYKNNWPKYKQHFYLPIKCSPDLCYEARPKDSWRTSTVWIGMQNLKFKKETDPIGPYQIQASVCDADNPRQRFVPIYA